MLLYFDLCCLHRPFDDQSQPRVAIEADAVPRVLSHCESGGADMASSAALIAEAAQGRHPIRRAYAEYVMAGAVVFIPAVAAATRALQLEAAGLAPMDALHVASAEAAGVDYFCTCDDRLLRRARAAAPGLRIMSPTELLVELGL